MTDTAPPGRRVLRVDASARSAGDKDLATPCPRHALGLVGIDDMTVTAADRAMAHGEEAVASALAAIDALVPSRAA